MKEGRELSAGPGQRRPRERRWTIGELLSIVAMIAANLALLGEVGRRGGWFAWALGGVILVTNLAFCGVMGVLLRFRLIPLMTMFSTAALTEAFLVQAATADRDAGWIVTGAALGLLLLAAWAAVLHTTGRRGHSRR